MLPGNSLLSKYGVNVAVPLFALLVVPLAGLVIWQEWSANALDSLPILFWVLYVPWVGVSALLLTMIAFDRSPNKWNYTSRSVIGNMIILLYGTAQTAHYTLMPTWDDGRLFWLTLSVVMAFLGAEGLIQFYVERNRATK